MIGVTLGQFGRPSRPDQLSLPTSNYESTKPQTYTMSLPIRGYACAAARSATYISSGCRNPTLKASSRLQNTSHKFPQSVPYLEQAQFSYPDLRVTNGRIRGESTAEALCIVCHLCCLLFQSAVFVMKPSSFPTPLVSISLVFAFEITVIGWSFYACLVFKVATVSRLRHQPPRVSETFHI